MSAQFSHSAPPHARTTPRAWSRWLASIAASLAVLAAAHGVAPAVAVAPLAAFCLGFVVVAAQALAVACWAPALSLGRALAVAGALAALLFAGWAWQMDGLAGALLVTAVLLSAGTLLGRAVGRRVEHAGYLLFVACVSALVDVFSVLHPAGPSQALARSQQALSWLALPWAMLGSADLVPLLGVGDVVFGALYLGAAERHALSLRRTLLGLAVGYLLTLSLVLWLAHPLPALPLLGAAVVVVHPAARRPPRADARRGWALVGGLALLLAALFLARAWL